MHIKSLFLALSVLLVHANAAETPRTCRILFLAKPASAPEKLYLHDGINTQEIEVNSLSFSPIYPIAKDSRALAILTQRPANPAESPPSQAPKALLSENTQDFYLILSSDPHNKIAPVRLQIIDADAKQFRAGQMLWFNLTDHTLGGLVGTQKLLLAPKSKLVMHAPTLRDSDYPVNIHYLPTGQKQQEPLCETRWIHDSKTRNVLFVLQETGTITPRIIGIPDFRE